MESITTVRHRQLSTVRFPAPASAAPLPAPATAGPISLRAPGASRKLLFWALLAAAAVAFGALAGTMAGTSGHGRPTLGTSSHTRAHLSTAASLAISRGLGADLAAYRLARSRGGFLARNARQGLTASFGARGATVSTRQGAQTRIALQAIGYGAGLHQVGLAQPSARGNRVEYRRREGTEWFTNGPLGIEQGFTVAAPTHAHASHTLALTFALSGSLRARLQQGGVVFGEGGRTLMRYGDLQASDARGRALSARMALHGDTLSISVDTRGARYPVRIDPMLESTAPTVGLTSHRGQSGETFGSGVAVSGNTVVVGAGDLGNNSGVEDVVYVFTEPEGGWSLSGAPTAKLITSSGDHQDGLGWSVAISGSTIVAGAPLTFSGGSAIGAAYVFKEPAGGWKGEIKAQSATLEIPVADREGARFGTSVAISGSTIVAGAPGYERVLGPYSRGAAYVFTEPAGGWTGSISPTAKLTATALNRRYLGESVAISGDSVVAGAPVIEESATSLLQGGAYIFTKPSTGWADATSPTAVLSAPDLLPKEGGEEDLLGHSVAATETAIAVGAPETKVGSNFNQGAVDVYNRPASGKWVSSSAPVRLSVAGATGSEELGSSVAISGSKILAGADENEESTGLAYSFKEAPGGWTDSAATGKFHGAPIKNSEFGWSVALDRGTLLVGAPYQEGSAIYGEAYIFSQPAEPIAVTGQASGIIEGSATLNATVNPAQAALTSCEFEYGTSVIYESHATCEQTVGAGEAPVAVTANIGGLAPGSVYHFRITAANANGSGDGVDQTFTTPPASKGKEGEPPKEKLPEEKTSTGGGGSTTTTTPGGSTTAPTVGPSTMPGAIPAPVATAPKAVEELLLGCSSGQLVLNNAYIHGGRVVLSGSAAKSLIGKKIKILFNEGKAVATATVEANGQYTTTAPLPPARIRDNLDTRYTAEIGKLRSLHLKLVRRLLLEPLKASGTTVTLTGRVTPPLTKPIAPVTVEQQLECGKTTVAKTFTPSAGGRFEITVTVPSNARAAIFRLTSKVAANKHSVKHGFTTFSLPLPVALG